MPNGNARNDGSMSFAHAVRLTATLAMTIKNNLVKTFLTSIKLTLDNLSRKIKNPCLVINFKFIHKGGNYLMNNFNKFFTYMAVGALVMVLSVSCGKNPAEPEGVEVSEDFTESVPTATGDPATDLTNAYYGGALSLKSHSVNVTSGISKEELENKILSLGNKIFLLNITNNNLKWAEYYISDWEGATAEQMQESLEMELYNKYYSVQLLKSGSKYSVSEVFDSSNFTNSSIIGYKTKSYIEFTISGDNISITYIDALSRDYELDGTNYKFSYKTTYEGTLTNYTPAYSGF